MKIKLSKQVMQDILYGEATEDGGLVGEIVEDKVVDHSRWSVGHEIIFLYQGDHYSAWYSVGATESQDESPWEYEDEVECTRVKKIEKIIEVWEPV